MAMRSKRARPRSTVRNGGFYYRALSIARPVGSLADKIKWVKFPLVPPDFVIIEILNGVPTPYQCHASRGTIQMAGDRVCWVNKDNRQHIVQFLSGTWPFAAAQNPAGDEKIVVPALGASDWYVMAAIPGSPQGVSATFSYYIDVAPPPPGPGVLSDD